MKVRFKLGFRYDAEEVAEFEYENVKVLWDELKNNIDFDIVDNPDNSRISDMYFEYEILEVDE